MTIEIPTAGNALRGLEPFNVQFNRQYITQWRPIVIGQNFFARNPQTGLMQQTRCYAINCNVDLTSPGGTAIHYISEFGDELIYYAYYPGVHQIMAWGITYLGTGINGNTATWGV